jgi:hypothetical protein
MAMVSTGPAVPKPVVARDVVFDNVLIDIIRVRIDPTNRIGVRSQMSHGSLWIYTQS